MRIVNLGRGAMAAITLVATYMASPARGQAPTRSVVPIREVDIQPEGTPRYVIRVVVNGVAMDAGLDTGSVGLRLLPRAVAKAGIVATGPSYTETYGSGVVLDGPNAAASVQIGALQHRIGLQAVHDVGCKAGGDGCNAHPGTLDPAQYGLMGLGHPGQGFPAIIGVRLAPGNVEHPLKGLGAQRWIIHLPPRQGGGGALILNPNEDDVAGFVPLATASAPRGAVNGCVMIARPDARRICGGILWDTGAASITVKNAPRPPAWVPNAIAEMHFASNGGTPGPALAFRTGDRAHGSEARFEPANTTGTMIQAGVMPFYAYDMLFDANGGIAIRPTADQSGLPRAIR